jgi:serine-type D-Ala-D-Ala endopeptidase (penicillin-binding protein 7)
MRILKKATLALLACLALSAHAQLHSEAYLVKNLTDNVVITEHNTSSVLTPASITKLMTVLVVLDSGAPMDEKLVVPNTTDTSPRIQAGMTFTRQELIQLALVSSDNKAARTLGHFDPQFVNKMNEKAKALGMANTHFVEPTGRNYDNVTTAEDLVLLLEAAKPNLAFVESAATVKLSFVQRVKNRIRKIVARPTNPMAGNEKILVAKTGFTNAAKFCIASIVRQDGKDYAIILLGSPNKTTRLRDFKQAMTMLGS